MWVGRAERTSAEEEASGVETGVEGPVGVEIGVPKVYEMVVWSGNRISNETSKQKGSTAHGRSLWEGYRRGEREVRLGKIGRAHV